MTGATATALGDGRLHLHHGPIDVILEAFGLPGAVRAAHARAVARFDGLLEELVAELPALRSATPRPLRGPIARAMADAIAPHRPVFVTPMAAVAGAVADALCAALAEAGDLTRAYANDGGDIALHLAPGAHLTVALGTGAERVTIGHGDPVRGLATSGWRGRSLSMGIADAVTVLARDAASADVAATLIANATDLPGHPAIHRRPASEVQADSDLCNRPVTVAVGPLRAAEVARALEAGARAAEAMRARGLIAAAALFLAGAFRTVGPIALPAPRPEHALG
jgi:hypothetical protein